MIGIFDSGVGGLTVAREFKRIMPDQPIIYLGDTARVPWGNKSPETIQEYSSQICDFFVAKKISTIVIACNTASAVAGDYLRKKFGQIQFVDVVDPAVERICSGNFSKVAIIGTRATIGSGVYGGRILAKSPKTKVYSQACPLFVPLVEENWTEGAIVRQIVQKYLQTFLDKKVDAVVLGCTHYSLLTSAIRQVMGDKTEIISCAVETAKIFKQKYWEKNQQTGKEACDQYYFTDVNKYHCDLIRKIMKVDVEIKKISFE